IEIILKGLDDKLEMDGEFYSNNMAAHADLNDEQIADLLTYIRNNWNNRAGVISSREVKVVRKKLK
ncbi:MAG: c-type cytochrome, partial [Sediminibacterium sp.]